MINGKINFALSLALLIGTIFIMGATCFATPQPVTPAPPKAEVCAAGDACDSFLKKYILPTVDLLIGLVGVVGVISLVVAGIQYSSSEDDPGKVSKAKQRIFNTILGLVAFILLWAFLQFIIPGGVFS